jgi:Flavodoxin domain
MRAVVAYESMFGATRAIAEAIASGLADYGGSTVVRVSDVGGSVLYGADLVVVGGPTHAWSMSRPSTRKGAPDYAKKHGGDLAVGPGAIDAPGVREWLGSLGQHTLFAAAFDTRVKGPAALSGRASKAISRSLARHGMFVVASPESFLVDKNSRLLPGEVERAAAWGASLARTVQAKRGAAVV